VSDESTKRPFPLGVAGLGLLLVAAVLVVAVAARPRHRSNVDAGSEASASCRDFEDVYAATKPGTPLDGPALAAKLDSAITHMHRAASADARYRSLAGSLDDVGNAVNAGDAPRSFAAMQDIHRGCGAVLNPQGRA
jgi:hypothetical protein